MVRPAKPGTDAIDLTVVAVPGYFAAMGLEYLAQRRRLARGGAPSAGDYERRDTLASLAMGTLSLLAPFVAPVLLRPITPGRGRFAKAAVVVAAAAVAATTVADAVARRSERPVEPVAGVDGYGSLDAGPLSTARRLASVGGVAAVAVGGVAIRAADGDARKKRALR